MEVLKSDEFYIGQIVHFMNFLSNVLDKEYELVLSSFSDGTNKATIVCIRNGFISGRKVGDGILPEGQQALGAHAFKYINSVINYEAVADNGNRLLCSSMLFENDEHKPIALFSINRVVAASPVQPDESGAAGMSVKDVFSFIMPGQKKSVSVSTNYAILEQCKKVISDITGAFAKPEQLSRKERVLVINELKKRGVFQMKSAVNITADFFHLSEPTIYRYLQKA